LWIKHYAGSKPRYESSNSTKKIDAVRLLNRRKADVDSGLIVPSSVSVGELLTLYIADMQQQNRKSLRDAQTTVPDHLLPAFANRNASEITSRLINRFIEAKQHAGYENSSIKR
jgi:hypothetical protein